MLSLQVVRAAPNATISAMLHLQAHHLLHFTWLRAVDDSVYLLGARNIFVLPEPQV